MTNEAMRESFELWASSLGYSMTRFNAGDYVVRITNALWEAWQASRAVPIVLADDWIFKPKENVHHQNLVVGGQHMRALCKEVLVAQGYTVKES